MTESELRDSFAASAYPLALQGAIKGYGHLCDTVTERAVRDAYAAAEVAMVYRRKFITKDEAEERFGVDRDGRLFMDSLVRED